LAIAVDRFSRVWIVPLPDHPGGGHPVEEGSRFYGIAWTAGGKLISQLELRGHFSPWLIDPNSGNQQSLMEGSSMGQSVVASRDGKYLVYSSNRDGTFHLWRSRQDGSHPERLTSERSTEEEAVITPDSQWVVYTSDQAGYPSLWKISIDGGSAVQLTSHVTRKPAISPDGKLIAAEYIEDPLDPLNRWSIAILDARTGDRLRLIPNVPAGQAALPVQWSADNQSLLYVRTRDDVSNVWMQAIHGGIAQQVTHFIEDRIFAFALSADGRSLACIRGTKTSDVVLRPLAQ